MNPITDRYRDFGLPATLPQENIDAWNAHLAGESVPLRLLPTNGERCFAASMGGPICGYSLLIDGSCPNQVDHRETAHPCG